MSSLACRSCYEHKIRCEQRRPCANCSITGVPCIARTPAPRPKRRSRNQELQERLARCERVVEQLEDLASVTPVYDDSPQTPQAPPTPPKCWTGELAMEEGGVRFIDDFLIARLRGEINAIRDILGSRAFEQDMEPHDMGWLVAQGPQVLQNFQPSPAHLFALWHIFLGRVHPLTKVIHAPSLQPYVVQAASSFGDLSLSYQGLLFSILAMATMSLRDEEAERLLNMSRLEALNKFSKGARIALAQAQCWKHYDMTTLQAMFLYMSSLRSRFDRHALWVLTGMAVRIAQKMGYHQDGTTLQLPPFETEMRRRIWWQLVLLDTTSAIASGSNQLALPGNWNTQQPQNLNDADLYPELREAPTPRAGPTEMGFCLVLYQITKFLTHAAELGVSSVFRDVAHENATCSPEINAGFLDKTKIAEEKLRNDLSQVYTDFLSIEAGEVHRAALTLQSIVLSRLTHEGALKGIFEKTVEIQDANDFLLQIFTLYSERTLQIYDTMSSNEFLWFFKSHFLHEAITVMAGKICLRPTGPLADHAWRVIERIYAYHPELEEVNSPQAEARLILNAWELRQQNQDLTKPPLETPQFILNLSERLGKIVESCALDWSWEHNGAMWQE
ncbi:hypothetical protein FDECE_14444 [Fusarium decemcellulare]|nr:hypothetical protein FDECE_14444 [Fusarium decemcellulare]